MTRQPSETSSWFDDPDVLIAELRHSRAAPRPAPGLTGFENLEEIGRGGQAVVYSGFHLATKRRVAVKVLLDGALASQGNRQRFEREIELVASLRHPHIVAVYDSGTSLDGHPYCVMEYVDGVPLDDYLVEQRVAHGDAETTEKFLSLFASICEAVNYAHQRGVIHRDLKPSNIRIDRQGVPRILDFGLAKLSSADTATSGASIAGHFVGSLAWASPEQTLGDSSQIDIRSDVYSLGLILYQALTGRFPYNVSDAWHTVLHEIQNATPARPRAHNPRISRDVETIILRSLAKEPDRRYQTAGDLAADLRRALAGEPVAARSDSTGYVIRRTLRRHRTAITLAGLAIVSTVVFSIVMAVLYGRALRAEQEARKETSRSLAIRNFLEEMLASADPESLGRDVTVRTVLDEASRKLDNSLAGEPVVRATLHGTIARTFRNLGDFASARRHFDAALKQLEAAYGPNDPNALEIKGDIAELLIDQTRPDEAEPVIMSLLDAAEPDTGLRLRARETLARLRSYQGRWDEARDMFLSLIEQRKSLNGEESREALTLMNNLATVYHATGQYEAAEKIHRTVLDAHSRRSGRQSPTALKSLGNLAAVLNSLGRFTEAEAALREQITGAMAVWGLEHRTTLIMHSNLAYNLVRQGKHAEALEIVETILPVQQRVLGSAHGDTIQSLNLKASAYIEVGRYQEAIDTAQLAYESCRKAFGEASVDTLTSMHNLGGAFRAAGRLDEAADILAKSLEISKRVYAKDHPDLAWAMNELAGVWVKQKKIDEAAALYSDAIRIVRKSLPPDHYFLPWLIYNRGMAYLGDDRYAEAERDLLECYEIYRARGGDAHPDTQDVIRPLAKLYGLIGDTEKQSRFESRINPATTSSAPAADSPAN